MEKNCLAEKLSIALIKRNKKKSYIAEKSNVTSSAIYHMFKHNDFRESDARKICELLGCRLEIKIVLEDTGEEI